jgi:regulator of protease activity HflC (stomatin/prohibitin superfamily)
VTTAFAWLNELMTWLARWVPRLTLIKKGDVGVLYGRAGAVEPRAPGLWVWWPIIHDMKIVSTRDRSFEVASQLHHGECIGLVVRWRVVDAVLMVVSLNDPGAYLDDRIQAGLAMHYNPRADNVSIAGKVQATLLAELRPFGIEVLSTDVAQRSDVMAFKELKDWANHENQDV